MGRSQLKPGLQSRRADERILRKSNRRDRGEADERIGHQTAGGVLALSANAHDRIHPSARRTAWKPLDEKEHSPTGTGRGIVIALPSFLGGSDVVAMVDASYRGASGSRCRLPSVGSKPEPASILRPPGAGGCLVR